ncbi:polymorphic toxin-type HINT domain-containing protein, partial [Streptomyces sp. NPDC060031]|uniref:polymorphic toxin-type HINT domain-containing protein n=1 Tax=Streptomyces sp. NPDC060031 TaxID=3347043 RepID=UPI0036B88F1C
ATARAAAALARDSAAAADQARIASSAAGDAAAASRSAGANADAAASAAEQANDYADAAGNHSAEARNAAADARRHANAANRAADSATALAARSAGAAAEARDAARSAATHADNAAGAAEEAAKHAGESAAAAEQANKHAAAAKTAADAAGAAVETAKKVFAIARDAEAADLATRTETAIERAKSRKAQAEEYVAKAAAEQLDVLALNTTATALKAEADKPDVDVKATAAKGRALALKALKLRGPWSQEEAGRALAGTDAAVVEYLRSGWNRAGGHEVHERVYQLSTQSPYPGVRTAAANALKGSDQQVADFYASGQYVSGTDDLAVRVSQINNTGGPSVKDASRAALAKGTGQAMSSFVNVGQYTARRTDEEVIASKLVTAGGPEVKAAAKIALAGPADQLHEFVTVGQYMADRKDQLAAHHVNQVDRLIAEASVIAAKAQQNRWKAAEAAAKANQASAEANNAYNEAKKSAEAAGKYATDATNSANAAQTSANQAAKSASTARAAAARADADAKAAADSAAQAEFSAQYARQSAVEANDSATLARSHATAAGKSAEEATSLALQAWGEVQKKREAEEAEARRKAEELRKKEQETAKKKEPRRCIPHLTREEFGWRNCLMAPGDSVLEMPEIDPAIRDLVFELTGIADIKKCIEDPNFGDCAMAVVGVLPVGKGAKVLKWGLEGVEAAAESRRLKKVTECLIGAANSFPAGTRVLLGDGSTRPIEQVRIGDMVLATDPETGVAGPRRVTATIYTPDDRDFTDLTLAGGGLLTATDHHPFWSQTAKAWKDAAELTAGEELRTDDGTSVRISAVRHWTTLQPAYNLTVDGLHTFYVLAGPTPVLVHNTKPCGPPLKSLHPDSSLAKSSLDFWHKQDTEDIVFSLRSGGQEPLIAKADGTIMNGNTRVAVLRSRGYDVDSLPRESYTEGKKMTDEDFWDMDQ